MNRIINVKNLSFIIYFLSIYIACAQLETGNPNTVVIGAQVWSTENLNVTVFNNGDPIPEAKNKKDWDKAIKRKLPAWCYFEYDAGYGVKYGKLYNWYALSDSRGIVPKGFHIPHLLEWEELINFIGGSCNASRLCSSKGWPISWQSNCDGYFDFNGSDVYGLNLKYGAFRSGNLNAYKDFYEGTNFWTSKENLENNEEAISIRFDLCIFGGMNGEKRSCQSQILSSKELKGSGLSVRILKD